MTQLNIGPATFEYSPDGLGLATARPRVSWRLPIGSPDQTAYELEVRGDAGVTTTGRVASPERSLVPWPAEPLRSRRRARVRVRVWTAGRRGSLPVERARVGGGGPARTPRLEGAADRRGLAGERPGRPAARPRPT